MMSNEIDNSQKAKTTDPNIEWDNGEATYGHSISESDFKRKNSPNKNHINKTENDANTIDDLKNENLSQGEDIGNRNKTGEKGLGGKDL
ncbi:hypothetical protein [Pedobacter sp. Leaf250]|uniref:hypothetical protein n=1 Tax=Pedobacter sp. Leaf250 TaxID=2876559 RepID=UPI001E2ED7E3|nr:hypothetical protein [Pedobacter sp. Leaf250]